MKYLINGLLAFLLTLSGITTVVARGGDNLNKFAWNKAYFYNFYSVFPASTGEVWVVGSKGMICTLDKRSQEWLIQESGVSGNLYRVVFTDSKNGWISGQNGLILHTENGGDSWEKQETGTNEHLFCLSFTDSNTGWVVGAYGTILHTSDGGKTWKKQGPEVDKIYNSVCFVDSRQGWVAGEFGAILHTMDGGQSWVEQVNPLGESTLFSVFFTDPLNGWATGMDGAVISTDDGGNSWRQVDSKSKEHLLSINVKGASHWAVGLKGTFAIKQNGFWEDATMKIPTRAWLKQCAFTDEKNGWIVGSVGTVLRTADGGNTWVPAYMSAGK